MPQSQHICDEQCAAVHAPMQMIVRKAGQAGEIKMPYIPSRDANRPVVRGKLEKTVAQYDQRTECVPVKAHHYITEKDTIAKHFDYKEAMGTRILRDEDKQDIENRYYVTARGMRTQDELGHFTWKDHEVHQRRGREVHTCEEVHCAGAERCDCSHRSDKDLYESSRRAGMAGAGVKTMFDATFKDDGEWE